MSTDSFILYIEDERPMMELVRHVLSSSGYNVVGSYTGRQGLDIMRDNKPNLLLLDLMMPQFNGWDVYREMKGDEVLADIPVIVLTAKIPEVGRKIVDDLPPVEDYITKPFDVEHLLRVVKSYIKTVPPDII